MSTVDDKGNKALGGGLMKRQMPEQQITNYINVTSVDSYSYKVRDLGWNALSPKHAVPGMGYRKEQLRHLGIWFECRVSTIPASSSCLATAKFILGTVQYKYKSQQIGTAAYSNHLYSDSHW